LDVLVKGFKNSEEAIEFMSWYEGQGEQDFSIWLECRKDEGLDVRDFIPTESYDRENKVLHLKEA